MFGAILSATDPVAVVALLREIGECGENSILTVPNFIIKDLSSVLILSKIKKRKLNEMKGSNEIKMPMK